MQIYLQTTLTEVNKMIIRKIKPEELKRTLELFAIAFEFSDDLNKSPEETFKDITENPKSREDVFWGERWAAFEDDDKTMMSYFIDQPFPVQFDGNVYTMTGIGGVATLPQYRKCGGIRGCFEAALPAMYQDGVAFSYLYPFSSAYYRKFGYEMGCERLQYHVRLSSVKHFDVSGNCSLVEPGNLMLDEIQQIYRVWQNKYNMMIANEDYEFSWVKKSNPVKDQVFTYVYKSKNGEPMGYLSVKQIIEPDGRNLQCTRFCCTCPEGLKGLLNVLIALGSDHEFATFEVPADVDLTLILPEWAMGSVSLKKYWAGMVRVVNVETVLKGARYHDDGTLSIAVTDKQIAANCGTFVVTFTDGKAVSVEKSDTAAPDISMGINEFSRLIIGTCDDSSLAYMDNVTIHNDVPGIRQVFYRKPNMIAEYF